jgi:hypothetical protein
MQILAGIDASRLWLDAFDLLPSRSDPDTSPTSSQALGKERKDRPHVV